MPSPTAGKGRILENLTEVDPLETLLAERVQTTRRGRKPGSKNKPKPAAPASTQPKEAQVGSSEAGHADGSPEAFGEDRFVDTGSRAEEAAGLHNLEFDAPLQTAAKGIIPSTRRIRGRYVTGSEPKPGERWRRRLRIGR